MQNSFNIGIDVVTQHLGELPAGKAYLLAGERGTAKTAFMLQFLYQGLKERQPCVMVSNQPSKNLVVHAETLGMNLSSYIKSGTLRLYEITRKNPYPPAELFYELKNIITADPVSRFALEGLAQSSAPAESGGSLAAGISALIGTLEGMQTTSFISLRLPIADELSPLKEALEDTVNGSFLLQSTTNVAVKTLSVLKLSGGRTERGEFPFSVEPGRGIVEALAKTSGIKFPRSDDN